MDGLGFRVWGLGFRVWGLGFGVWSLGFRVWGFGVAKMWNNLQQSESTPNKMIDDNSMITTEFAPGFWEVLGRHHPCTTKTGP